MTKVTFYKINNDSIPLGLVCELVQKAYCSSHQVLCQVPSQQVADSLDSLLWTHDPASFIPHGVGSKNIPVAISNDPFPGDHYQLLINLCHEIPEWFSRFERIIEIVNSDKSYQDSKRENFQFYKDRGYPLEYYDLTNRTAQNKS